MNFKHGLYYFLLQSKNISKIFNKMSLKCLKSVNSVYWPVYGMTGIINMPVFTLLCLCQFVLFSLSVETLGTCCREAKNVAAAACCDISTKWAKKTTRSTSDVGEGRKHK